MERSGNPVLKEDTFQVSGDSSGGAMTLQGTVDKTFLLLALCVGGAFWAWSNPAVAAFWWACAIGGFVVALVTIFFKRAAGITAPLYSILEGVVLGTLSLLMDRRYPGIVIQSVGLTFGVMGCLLAAYKTRLIEVTENMRLGIIAATGGIAILYLIDIGLSFFGHRVPMIHESGPMGILFSLFVVSIASFNLVLDFDFIERGAESGAPKYMEWYGGFSLMVTLVWLYMEILRLLSKGRKN